MMSNGFDCDSNYEKNNSNNSLCCCEYYNEYGIRSHLLTLCCNCQAIDDTFDRIIRCDSVPNDLLKSIMKTIGDRIRYPYCDGKGARTLNLQTILPPILLTVLIMSASIGPIITFFSLFIALPTIIYGVYKHYCDKNQLRQTKFFLSWSVSSLIILICVFEIEVYPYLEILFTENFVLISLTALALILVIIIRKNESEMLPSMNSEVVIYNHWIQSPVSNSFYIIYLLSLLSATIALTYGSQLTLTTICHSTLFFETILIPDDCSEVYIDMQIGICFVCAVYALQIAICIFISLTLKLWKCICLKPNHKYIEIKRDDN